MRPRKPGKTRVKRGSVAQIPDLVRQIPDCLSGTGMKTRVVDPVGYRSLLADLAAAISSKLQLSNGKRIDPEKIWVDVDPVGGLHVHLFRSRVKGRASFRREHAHYYIDSSGELTECHRLRKSLPSTKQIATKPASANA